MKLADIDLLTGCVRHVALRAGGAAGVDGMAPSFLGQFGRSESCKNLNNNFRRAAGEIQRLFEAGIVKPKRCVGPAMTACPTVLERVIGRYITLAILGPMLRGVLDVGAPPLPGSSCQAEQEEVSWWAKEAPAQFAIVTDFKGCFESIGRKHVRRMLVEHDAPAWAVEWIMLSLKKSGFQRGLVRGYSWAASVAALVLADVDRVVADVPGVVRQARYGDDSIVIVRTAEEAAEVLRVTAVEAAKIGLRLNQKKTYVGPLGGSFKYLGLEFEAGRAHPSAEAVVQLMSALRDAEEEMRRAVLEGWLGSYSVAADSPRIVKALEMIPAEFRTLGNINSLLLKLRSIATRSSRRRIVRRYDPAYASGYPQSERTGRTKGNTQGTRKRNRAEGDISHVEKVHPAHSPLPRASANPPIQGDSPATSAVSGFVSEPRAAGGGAVGPFTPRGARVDLSFELEFRPHELRALPRFGFREHLRRADVREVVALAESVNKFKLKRSWRPAGFASYAGFCRLILNEHEDFVDRVAGVGLAVAGAAAEVVGAGDVMNELLDDDTDDDMQAQLALVPARFVRRALRVRGDRTWVLAQVRDLTLAIVEGRCTTRAALASLHSSVGRAIREARKSRERRRGVSWGVLRRDGGWQSSDGRVRAF